MSMRNRYQAVAELLSRYKKVMVWAWRGRHRDAIGDFLPHEAEFLPAALSLRETPLSPAPRLSMLVIVIFALIALAWACFGSIDVVATAQGKIVPNDRIKTIQPFETSAVKKIYVSDGAFVKAGQVLIELDGTIPAADQRRIESDLSVARLQVLRAKALLTALKNQSLPHLPESANGIASSNIREAEQQVQGQYNEYQTKLLSLDAETSRHQAEHHSTMALVQKLEQTVPLVRQRADDFKVMASKQFVAEHEFLEREQLRIEQEGELATQRSRLNEIAALLREAQGRKRALTAETQRIALDSLNEGMQKVAGFEQELLKAQSHGQLMTLTSPVDGTVQQLAVHTVGGVVTPAQALMVIVPGGQSVEVEAFIENKDIGFVKANQDAEAKIETFQYTKYGTIPAKVISVSHDAINDEKRGLIYASRIKMHRSTMNVDGTMVKLSPGMAVSVEIKTGRRRVIEYFLSPLLAYKHESFRER